jgi:hypothetical protein
LSSQQLVSRANQEEHREKDGTVIFSLERVLSGGTKLTLELANDWTLTMMRIFLNQTASGARSTERAGE